jgi:hypothetical protein
MTNFLQQLMGKNVDISAIGTGSVRGEIVDIQGNVLFLRDQDDKVAYIAIDKISIVWEVKDHESRAGFVV